MIHVAAFLYRHSHMVGQNHVEALTGEDTCFRGEVMSCHQERYFCALIVVVMLLTSTFVGFSST